MVAIQSVHGSSKADSPGDWAETNGAALPRGRTCPASVPCPRANQPRALEQARSAARRPQPAEQPAIPPSSLPYVPLGDATRRPTPDAELPALSAGVVGRIVRASHSLYGPLSGSAPGALATSSAERSSTDAPSAAEANRGKGLQSALAQLGCAAVPLFCQGTSRGTVVWSMSSQQGGTAGSRV